MENNTTKILLKLQGYDKTPFTELELKALEASLTLARIIAIGAWTLKDTEAFENICGKTIVSWIRN